MKSKKIIAALLASMMVFSLTACNGSTETTTDTVSEGTVSDAEAEAATDEVAVNPSIDFEDGLMGFMKVCTTKGNGDESVLSVVDYNGSQAVYAENVSGASMYIGVNVSALLGDRVADVRTISVDIGTEYADGSFSASSGFMYAYVGEDLEEVKGDSWSVYLEDENPKTATFEMGDAYFTAGCDNYILISKETDNGATVASMYFDNFTFYDEAGNVIEADSSAEFGSPAGFEATGADLSNLCAVNGAVNFEGFEISGDAWAQNGLDMPQEIIDALVPGSVVEIEYASETGNMWLVMPDAAAGWMRVGVGDIDGSGTTASYMNNSRTIAQVTYEQLASLCGDDVSTWGARMQCESDGAWEVYSVRVGQAAPVYGVGGAVEFEGFATSADAWAQNGFDMPQEIIDALVPGSVVEIDYASESGDLWIVMPDATAGWMRVGVGNADGSGSDDAACYNGKCYVTYEQLAAVCGDDVSTWGARMQCESDTAWEVFGVRVGMASEMQMVNRVMNFEGFATSADAWAQNGFDMPQEVIDALVPGAVVSIQYASESGDLWIVMPDATAGWSRVGVGNADGSGSDDAACANGVCQVTYEQIAAVCGDDVSAWGARMQCESDTAWEVFAVTVGQTE